MNHNRIRVKVFIWVDSLDILALKNAFRESNLMQGIF